MKILHDEDVLNLIAEQQSQFIGKASDWSEEVVQRLSGDLEVIGDPMPWQKTQDKIRHRMGEVTLWGGFNGHGKSQVLNQVCAWSLQKTKWLIASMEMKPAATMFRMTRQIAGCRDVNPNFARQFMSWTDNRLWIYDQTDTVESERILGVVLYAARNLGVKHIVIDSLMKCGFRGGKDKIASDQVAFVDRLCWAAKTNNVHIHLVHHMRKGEHGEYDIPGKHDFRGQGEIVDLVDNAIVVFRNKRKEESLAKGKTDMQDAPDSILSVVKQRHGEWEGKIMLWFHPDSFQYLPRQTTYPMQFKLN